MNKILLDDKVVEVLNTFNGVKEVSDCVDSNESNVCNLTPMEILTYLEKTALLPEQVEAVHSLLWDLAGVVSNHMAAVHFDDKELQDNIENSDDDFLVSKDAPCIPLSALEFKI
jgi:hypothetical protein